MVIGSYKSLIPNNINFYDMIARINIDKRFLQKYGSLLDLTSLQDYVILNKLNQSCHQYQSFSFFIAMQSDSFLFIFYGT